MVLFKNKYNIILLLALVLLTLASCHKGGEPVPKFDNVDSSSEEVVAPLFKDGSIDEEDSDDDGGGDVVGGDDGEDDDGGSVIGGDDGEDDDGGGTHSGGKSLV
jgi:hypothetical protein